MKKDEMIVAAFRRKVKGESLRAIAADFGVHHTTLSRWLNPRRLVNAMFRVGIKAPAIFAELGIPLRTIERYKSPETKAFLKSQLEAKRRWVREQLARGLTRRQIIAASGGELTYNDVCTLSRVRK